MKNILRTLLIISILMTFTLLSVSFYFNGYWVIFPLLGGLICFSFITNKITDDWPDILLLGIVLFCAAAGLLWGVSQWMMLSAGVFALLSWDLKMLFDKVKMQPASPGLEQLIKKHLQTLLFATAAGWLLVLLGSGIHFKFPFAVMALLVLIIFFGIDRLVHWLLTEK